MYMYPHLCKIKFYNALHTFSIRNKSQNHYDVLKLSRNCTQKQIKESYVKLSKKYHPDLNKSKDAHKKFLDINESYKVLSNAETRRNYDLGLIQQHTNSVDPEVYNRYKNGAFKDPSFYENRNKDSFDKDSPYYGIKGQRKVSNLKVVTVCLCLTIILVGLQFYLINKSSTFQRDELIRRSQSAQESLDALKKGVNENGNELQLEILKKKFAEQNQDYREE